MYYDCFICIRTVSFVLRLYHLYCGEYQLSSASNKYSFQLMYLITTLCYICTFLTLILKLYTLQKLFPFKYRNRVPFYTQSNKNMFFIIFSGCSNNLCYIIPLNFTRFKYLHRHDITEILLKVEVNTIIALTLKIKIKLVVLSITLSRHGTSLPLAGNITRK